MQEATHPQLAWLLDWIQQYPVLTGIFIFSVAMLESLVLIGISIPGAALIIAFGALIALGYLDFMNTMLLCIAGAIAGDGISFWIGYRYQKQLKNIWPFKYFKSQLKTGEEFFRKHGGKSVVFGRFVGPVRAVIPTIAGMMGMSPMRFTVINVLSAIAWAPAYLFPGMVFGASLELASEVAIRLVTLILAVFVLLFIIRWLVRRAFRYLQPRTDQFTRRSLRWARRHRLLGPMVQSLVDPRQPESPALVLFALILILSGVGFFLLLYSITGQASALDQHLHELMLSLRTPWMDHIMVSVTMMADTLVISIITVLLLAWLLYKRNIPAALHLAAAIIFGAILTRVLKISLQVPRPDPELYIGSGHYSFPSAHSTMGMLLYGFIAIILSREIHADKRIHVYVGFGLLISLIAISRLYLGAHWLTDVTGGLTLGLIWITLLGIAYRRHASPAIAGRPLLIVSLFAIGLTVITHWSVNYEREWSRYHAHPTVNVQSFSNWTGTDWQGLPAYRHDLARTLVYPFNIQWNGKRESIDTHLSQHGWTAATRLSLSTAAKWLSSKTPINERPILPQVHRGQHEDMAFTYFDEQQQSLIIIRLWRSSAKAQDKPIWLGQAAPLTTKSFLNLFHYPVTEHDFRTPLALLQQQLLGLSIDEVKRSGFSKLQAQWGGQLLLISSDE